MSMIPRVRTANRRGRQGRRRRAGLRLESLESRRLLATLLVTTTADAADLDPGDGVCEIAGGGCSLRAAIQEANGQGNDNGPHLINVPKGTYTLTIEGTDELESRTGDLNIRTSLAIYGAGAAETVIDANQLDRVFDVVLGDVLIQGVTIRGGMIDAEEEAFEYIGGGIRNQAALSLVDSVVSGNTAGSGAGVANYIGTLQIRNSVITGNGDSTTTRGGGVFNYANYDPANLEIIDSTIRDNEALIGGGVMNLGLDGLANTSIQRSTIAMNSATFGGGIANRSKVLFEDSAFAHLSLRGSTVSGNTASGSGGGIHNQGEYGGDAHANVLNSTITGNVAVGLDGGGVQSVDAPQVATEIRSTIVAGNSSGRNGDDLFGQSISGDFNLIGSAAGHGLVHGSNSNLVGIDPRLGPLDDNGGPTQTHLLLAGSPAIDQGSNSLSLPSDQRGSAFLRTVDFPAIGNASDGTDIGAVEIGQTASEFDFGDAPDGIAVGNQQRRYPTKAANDGARHRIDVLGPFLGQIRPDAEGDGQSSAAASGDDLLGNDDEDAFPTGPIRLTPGQPIDGVIISHDGGTAGAFLNVWLDVNLDGDWDDAGEHLIVDRSVRSGAGFTTLSGVTLPSNATNGTSYIRARISTRGGLTPSGEAPDGEVEDVVAFIGDVPIETSDLSLKQIADNLNPSIGDTVQFTITITNSGPDRATNVEVTNVLPPEVSFERATVTSGVFEFEETWFIDVLQPGASAELRILAKVVSSDSFENTAEITFADQFDPDSTPGNGISGEDDQASVTLGTCLSAGPLHVGQNRVTFSCASPGAWVGFVHGTERGSKNFDQYNVTVDIADAEGIAIAFADPQGIASALINLSAAELALAVDDAGNPLIVQAFEMLPRRTKSNTLAINREVSMLKAERVGVGADSLDLGVIESVVEAAIGRWSQLPLPESLRQRLGNAKIVISDLPHDALARVVGRTIVLDADAAGNGWFVDPTPSDDQEFQSSVSASRLDAVDPTAARRIDLLTTLTHEFGHLLGLPHVSKRQSVMQGRLGIGIRWQPVSDTNPDQSLDVNRDNRVSTLDALQIVNWLGRQSLVSTFTPSLWLGDDSSESLFLDANADYRVSAADALLVINHMTRRNLLAGNAVEREFELPAPIPIAEVLSATLGRDAPTDNLASAPAVVFARRLGDAFSLGEPGTSWRELNELSQSASKSQDVIAAAIQQVVLELELHDQRWVAAE